jgi:hypothetical protein
VAQLGARFHGMEEVVGSIPTRSTKTINNLDRNFWESNQFRGNSNWANMDLAWCWVAEDALEET